jgi:hypothetical protein
VLTPEQREKKRERDRRYREKHSEELQARAANWNAENKDKVRAWGAKWRSENKDKVRAYSRGRGDCKARWRAENPDKARAISSRECGALTDNYIWHAALNMPAAIPRDPELIAAKRAAIMLFRTTKGKQNEH